MADYETYARRLRHLALPAFIGMAKMVQETRQTSLPMFLFGVSMATLAGITVYKTVNRHADDAVPGWVVSPVADAIQRAEADRDKYGALLFQACSGSLSDARAIDRSIPDISAAFNGISLQCELILPNGKMVTWPPGQMPLDKDWRFIPAG